jgi:UDP-2,4-diacetamido-2,4,6-trideoxy-beta-L-altropyranose hydrolase
MIKNFIFRVDASTEIGTGHVYRCLTLANYLKCQGFNCEFVCRNLEGNLAAEVADRGFKVRLQKKRALKKSLSSDYPEHLRWLSVDWQIDLSETIDLISDLSDIFLIVDHYGIERNWEHEISKVVKGLMVIDDLSNRHHKCNILLDQNLKHDYSNYDQFVSLETKKLFGPNYCLIRDEFSALQGYYGKTNLENLPFKILISMGGVDNNNYTLDILRNLDKSRIRKDLDLTVLVGVGYKFTSKLYRFAATSRSRSNIKIVRNSNEVAKLLLENHLVIGAAGSSAWERCCLGIPSIILAIAGNQSEIAKILSLKHAGIEIPIDKINMQLNESVEELFLERNFLKEMSKQASKLVDGRGVERVYRVIKDMYL